MSKALRVIGTIAGAVALVATGVGAFAAGAKAVAVAGQVSKIATVVGGVASVGAALTQKAPPARGSVTQVLISPDAPQPYVMGEGLFAGVLRHDTAYGATLNKVPNPYRFMPVVYSGGGPIESITPYVDQGPVSSWYSTFLYTDTQLGAVPEADALTPQWAGAPGWSTASKLSGKTAIGWSLKFDKDGKRFASGVPQLGAFGKWVKVYDPRKDSTFPGGSGSHRLGTESTYEWSENPALHCGTYAYGRYQNGKRVMGVGMPSDAIDWTTIAAWANVCDANAWTIFGAVYEPGDRWANLRDIAIAGGGEPVFAGGVLSFKYAAPKIPLDTITEYDLSDDDQNVTAMASWRDRINTVIPKYRSPDHNWELVAGDEVVVSSYVTEDGERKAEEYPFNFVKKPDQAEQLAAYRLVDGRELQPITITCGPRMFAYRPGECLHINLPFLSLDTDAIILKRDFDPARMTVTFTMIGETPAKHDFALGKTGNPPATPALKQTAEERDEISNSVVIGEVGPQGPTGATGPQGPTGATGPAGAAGAPATSAYLTNEAVQLFAYANGTVESYAGASGEFKVFAGSTDISANFTLSTQSNPQGLTISYLGRTYTVTGGFDAGEDTASVTIRATGSGSYSGVVFDKVLSLSKAKGGYEIVGSLPSTDLFSGRVVFNEADDKLYRYTGSAWTAAVPAVDVTGQIQYQQLADKAVRVQHLLVAPNNINPDPLFQDEAAWDIEAGGWFFEDAPGSSNANALGYRKYVTLWSGTYTGTARRHVWGKSFAYSGQGQNLRLRARCGNYSNQAMIVGLDFFNQTGGYLGGTYPSVAAGSGAQTLNHIFQLPAGVATIRLTLLNEAPGSAFSGNILATDIRLDVAADSSLIVDGAILARHIQSEEVTADKLSAGSVTAAKVGTNEIIAFSGNIKDLTVSTIKIAGNAVTLTSSAYTNTSVNLIDDTWVDVQSVTITTIGSPILILFNGQSSQVTSGVFDIIGYRILRDATVIQGPIENWAYADENRNVSLSITDVPSAGTITYKVQAFLQTSGGSANLTHRSLVAMETKR